MDRTDAPSVGGRWASSVHRIVIILMVAIAVATLTACSSDEQTASTAPPATYTDDTWGVSFTYPSDLTPEADPAKALASELLGPSDWGVVLSDTGDPDGTGDAQFAVLATRPGGWNDREPSAAEIDKGLRALEGGIRRRSQEGQLAMDIVGMERTKLGDHRALRVTATGDKGGTNVRLELYLVIAAKGLYAVMIGAPAGSFDQATADLEESVESLKIDAK